MKRFWKNPPSPFLVALPGINPSPVSNPDFIYLVYPLFPVQTIQVFTMYPEFIRHPLIIRIQEGYPGRRRYLDPMISGSTHPGMCLPYIFQLAPILLFNQWGIISRTVIHYYQLIIGRCLSKHRINGPFQYFIPVAGGDNNRGKWHTRFTYHLS